MTTKLTDASVHSIGNSLREFGYTTLTDAEVRETSDRIIDGGDDQGDVIAMFIRRMLVDAGVLKEQDPA